MWSLASSSKIQFSSYCLHFSQNTLLTDRQGSNEMEIMALDLTRRQECWECGTASQKAQLCPVMLCVCIWYTRSDVCYSSSLLSRGCSIFTSTASFYLSLSPQFTGFPEKSVNWTSATIWSPSLTLTWIWITRWVSLCGHILTWESWAFPQKQTPGEHLLFQLIRELQCSHHQERSSSSQWWTLLGEKF